MPKSISKRHAENCSGSAVKNSLFTVKDILLESWTVQLNQIKTKSYLNNLKAPQSALQQSKKQDTLIDKRQDKIIRQYLKNESHNTGRC